MSSSFSILRTDCTVQFSAPVLSPCISILCFQKTGQSSYKCWNVVLYLAEPTEWSIIGDYYTVHAVQVVMSCNCVDKKCHVFSTQSRNYLSYPTIRSIIEYFSHPAFLKGSPFFFPFVVDILPSSCLDFFVCCLCSYFHCVVNSALAYSTASSFPPRPMWAFIQVSRIEDDMYINFYTIIHV